MKLTVSAPANLKFQNIQAMRGIAAILIMLWHGFNEIAGISNGSFETPYYPYTIGVDLFFVISGFIMVYTSQHRFGAPGAWKRFIMRRVLRIVPLYWFYTTLLVLVALAVPSVLGTASLEGAHLFKSYFFIPHERPVGDLQPFLALGWTLNYEMYFYAIFAVLLFLPMKAMLWVLSTFLIGSVVAGQFIPYEQHALFFWSRPYVLEFLAGAWIACLFIKDIRLPEKWKYPAYMTVVVMAAGLFFLKGLGPELRWPAMQLAAVLSIAAVTLPRGAEHQGVPSALLKMGDASYTIYLSHPFVLGAVTQGLLVLGLFEIIGPWGSMALCIAGALIGGYILYLLIEKPLLDRAKHVFLEGSRNKQATS